ncbi:MAG: hypothetical protein AAGF59_14745, partial [Pseudomonadota bacterium]
SWNQEGFLRKFFLIYDPPGRVTPKIESAAGGIFVLNADSGQAGNASAPFFIDAAAASAKEATALTNDTGELRTGLWQADTFESEARASPVYSIVQMLEGTLSASENGESQTFGPGDVFFVLKGSNASWSADGTVAFFHSTLSRKEAS